MAFVFTGNTSSVESYGSELKPVPSILTDDNDDNIVMKDASEEQSSPIPKDSRKRKSSPEAESPEDDREYALIRKGEKGPIKLKIKLSEEADAPREGGKVFNIQNELSNELSMVLQEIEELQPAMDTSYDNKNDQEFEYQHLTYDQLVNKIQEIESEIEQLSTSAIEESNHSNSLSASTEEYLNSSDEDEDEDMSNNLEDYNQKLNFTFKKIKQGDTPSWLVKNKLNPLDQRKSQLIWSGKKLKKYVETFTRTDDKEQKELAERNRPRAHQIKTLYELARAWRHGKDKAVIVHATATGKTNIVLYIKAALKNKPAGALNTSLFIVPNVEMVDQTFDRFQQDLSHGLVCRKLKSNNRSVSNEAALKIFKGADLVITTMQSLTSEVTGKNIPFSLVDLMILDETHLIGLTEASIRGNIVKEILQTHGIPAIALTATPELENADLNVYQLLGLKQDGSDNPITPYGIKEAIKDGTNCPVQTGLIVPHGIDQISFKKTRTGLISEKDAEEKINRELYNKLIVSSYVNGCDHVTGRKFRGLSGVIFCAGIQHANNVAAEFNKISLNQYDPTGEFEKEYQTNAYIDFMTRKKQSCYKTKEVISETGEKSYISEQIRNFQEAEWEEEWNRVKEKEYGHFEIAAAFHSQIDDNSKQLKIKSEKIIRKHRLGGVHILTGALKLIEGYDNPRIAFVLRACPSFSNRIVIQSVGRGLRLQSNKILYVLELAWSKKNDYKYFYQQLTDTGIDGIPSYRFDYGPIANCRQTHTSQMQLDAKDHIEILAKDKMSYPIWDYHSDKLRFLQIRDKKQHNSAPKFPGIKFLSGLLKPKSIPVHNRITIQKCLKLLNDSKKKLDDKVKELKKYINPNFSEETQAKLQNGLPLPIRTQKTQSMDLSSDSATTHSNERDFGEERETEKKTKSEKMQDSNKIGKIRNEGMNDDNNDANVKDIISDTISEIQQDLETIQENILPRFNKPRTKTSTVSDIAFKERLAQLKIITNRLQALEEQYLFCSKRLNQLKNSDALDKDHLYTKDSIDSESQYSSDSLGLMSNQLNSEQIYRDEIINVIKELENIQTSYSEISNEISTYRKNGKSGKFSIPKTAAVPTPPTLPSGKGLILPMTPNMNDAQTNIHQIVNNYQKLEEYFKNKGNPNAVNENGETALHTLVQIAKAPDAKTAKMMSNYLDCLALLLENNININAQDKMGRTALFIALEFVMGSRNHSNSKTTYRTTPNYLFAYTLLAFGAALDATHPNVSSRYWIVSEFDIPNKHEDWKNQYLHLKKLSTTHEIDKIGLSLVTAEGHTLLHLAANLGACNAMEFFISKGLDINKKDSMGNTPLMLYFSEHLNFSRQTLGILLSNHANPDIENLDGNFALQLACQNYESYYMDVYHIFKKTSDTFRRCQDDDGNTPLHLIMLSLSKNPLPDNISAIINLNRIVDWYKKNNINLRNYHNETALDILITSQKALENQKASKQNSQLISQIQKIKKIFDDNYKAVVIPEDQYDDDADMTDANSPPQQSFPLPTFPMPQQQSSPLHSFPMRRQPLTLSTPMGNLASRNSSSSSSSSSGRAAHTNESDYDFGAKDLEDDVTKKPQQSLQYDIFKSDSMQDTELEDPRLSFLELNSHEYPFLSKEEYLDESFFDKMQGNPMPLLFSTLSKGNHSSTGLSKTADKDNFSPGI